MADAAVDVAEAVGLEGSGDAGKKRRGSDNCTGEETTEVAIDEDDVDVDDDDGDGADDEDADDEESEDGNDEEEDDRAADGDMLEDNFGRENDGDEYAISMGMIVTLSLDDDDDTVCGFDVVGFEAAGDLARPLSE